MKRKDSGADTLGSPHWSRGAALPLLLGGLFAASGCYVLGPSRGGGQTTFRPPRGLDPSDVAVPQGYRIEVVATGLTYPSAITFDDQGRAYVTEAGFSYGGFVRQPRLLRLEANGETRVIAEGSNPPWNGVDYHDGAFYVAGGHVRGGELLRITEGGQIDVILAGLPSDGDHHTNGPLVGTDGYLYFGQGTATNSGVVGLDNLQFGWLTEHPEFHDQPCQDITLTGRYYKTKNPLTPAPRDRTRTGAFVPFGTSTAPGQVIQGSLPCSGAVMRVRPDGSELGLVAWGLRNPFGLAWTPDGELYVTDNQYDKRGSRPVFGAGDLLRHIEPGAWYGWPNYWSDQRLDDQRFKPPGGDAPDLVLEDPAEPPPPAAAVFAVHSSSNGFDFSRSSEFGYEGQAFVAQFGDMAPNVGKVLWPVGFKVVRVDVTTGEIEDFAVNRGRRNGPASWQRSGGLERPVAARFDPSGEALYIVDFGVMTVHRKHDINAVPETGVIWRITREQQP